MNNTQKHLAARTITAAWRENLNHIRHHTTQTGNHYHLPTHLGPLQFTAHQHALDHLEITTPPTLNHHPTPADTLLHAITGHPLPTHLTADYASANHGHHTATTRQPNPHTTLKHAIAKTPATNTAHYTAHWHPTNFDHHTAHHLEPLATHGHWLHPLARTRLGWKPTDYHHYDYETPHPVHLHLLHANPNLIHTAGKPITGLLTDNGPHITFPMHPWQLTHLKQTQPNLFTHHLTDTGHTLPTWPTASVRTLQTNHPDAGFIKTSLAIRITTTDRGISPTTARLAPQLTHHLTNLTDHPLRHWHFMNDIASCWMPGSRHASAIIRTSLTNITPPGLTPVPALALPVASPTSDGSVASEFVRWFAEEKGQEVRVAGLEWLAEYARLLLEPAMHLASHRGIGMEAHQQNTLIAFSGPVPRAVIVRDLGGIRLWREQLPFAVEFPDSAPIATTDRSQTLRKVAFTVIVNHLGALIAALRSDGVVSEAAAWAVVADIVADQDIPGADRDYYMGKTLPSKAMLSMRLRSDQADRYCAVSNPLYRGGFP